MDIMGKFRGFISHHLVRSAVTLQIGNVAGTFVQAASGVLIARLLRPELFGQYSLAFSVASIATLLLGIGVQDAITPQVSRAWATHDADAVRRAMGFFVKCMFVASAVTVFMVVVLPFITQQIYGSESIGQYAGIIVVASLVSMVFIVPTQLMLQVAGRIRSLALVTFTDVFLRYTAIVILVLLGFGMMGAIAGHFLGALCMLGIVVAVYRKLAKQEVLVPEGGDLMRAARQASWQPLLKPTLWVVVDRNLAMLYGALPVAIVGAYASGEEIAYFKLAFGYIILAMTTLGPISTLLNVHFPTVQATNALNLRRTFIRTSFYATLLSAGVTLVVVAISPFVFRLLYGEVYMPAIQYVFGLALFGGLFGLGVGLGPMWRALDRVHVSIGINLVVLSVGIPLGIWAITRWHMWGAVGMVTVWYTISHVVSFVYLLRALKLDQK